MAVRRTTLTLADVQALIETLLCRRITQEFVEAGGTVSILQTNDKGLANSWEPLRQTGMAEGEEALEIGKDFLESESRQLLLSQRGIAAVARDLRVNSRITKARRAWIEAVSEVVETCFQAEIRYLTDGAEHAVKRAKAAADHRCEVTGKTSSRQTRIDLHRDFHSWNPGPCCPADVLRFLSTARGDLFDPVNARSMARLHHLSRRLNRMQKEREGQKLRDHKR